MKPLVGYVRVSTERQADEGFGLDVQRQGISRWARANEARIAVILGDEGISGAVGVEGRPALAEALAMVACGAVAGVVVARLDRLARTLAVQEAALAQVWKHGGKVFAADLGEVLQDDPDDPMRTAMRQMMGVFAQLERSMIAARLRAGRRMKAERGGYAYGSPGFGYRALDGVLVEDPSEQACIARVRELHGEGQSLRAIAAALAVEGFKPKRGERWHPSAIARLVSRTTTSH